MYIGFNLHIDEECSIFYGEKEFEELLRIGERHLDNQRASLNQELEAYVTNNTIDGTKIQNEWFPEIEADIFISHSGNDNDLANAFAGWLNYTFGLKCFIDSNVWGYSKTLLELMNTDLSDKRKDPNGGYLYNHESCNQVSQHVNVMLSIALQKMIDRAEAVVLLNTNNAVNVCSDKKMEKTYSPWIYSEIISTQFIRKKPLFAYRNYKSLYKSCSGILESVQFAMHANISYNVSLEHLRTLDTDDLLKWKYEYFRDGTNYEYALDALYCYKCPDDVESTQKVSSILQEDDLETLQHAYSSVNFTFEEEEKIQRIWAKYFVKQQVCSSRAKTFNDMLNDSI